MWKVGQTVWDSVLGEGLVVEYTPNGRDYSVLARFCVAIGETYTREYTEDGRGSKNWNRSLFFSEPKVEGSTEPPFEAKIKSGEAVSVVNKISGESCVFIVDKEDAHYIYPRFQTKRYYKREYTVHKIGEQVY